MKFLKKQIVETKALLRSVPGLVTALFCVSVIAMNLLANKSIVNLDWLALDAGISVSWVAFMTMDVVTKHYGPKAANQLSVVALLVNLLFSFIFWIGSVIPGAWGASFIDSGSEIVNAALDSTLGGSWYVLLGSSVAFVVSSLVNNFTNWGIGKVFKKNPDGFGAYACQTYVSTAIGQFVDNLTFALIVSHFFFGWTMLQCLTCAATGAVAELLMEVVFSPFGYKMVKRWKAEGVGADYFKLVEEEKK